MILVFSWARFFSNNFALFAELVFVNLLGRVGSGSGMGTGGSAEEFCTDTLARVRTGGSPVMVLCMSRS